MGSCNNTAPYLKVLRNTAKPLLDEKEFNNFNIVGSTKVKSDKEPIKSKSKIIDCDFEIKTKLIKYKIFNGKLGK